MSAPAVRFAGLTVERGGRRVLHGIEGAFAAGQVTGLFGPSGSGKSTLIRAIVGVQRGVRGTITVLGCTPGSASMRPQLGYMTQSPAVYDDLTVTENLRYFAAIRGSTIGGVLERVDLVPERHQLVLAVSMAGPPSSLLRSSSSSPSEKSEKSSASSRSSNTTSPVPGPQTACSVRNGRLVWW